MLVTSLSAYAPLAADYFLIDHRVEGYNVADFILGNAAAKQFTFSFWVKSSLTGVFSAALENSAGNRSYVFSYAIKAANAWEQKFITVTGDVTGTWLVNNGIGLNLRFDLGCGSSHETAAGAWTAGDFQRITNSIRVIGTNAATWQLTGVQLELGSVASQFELRSYGTEFNLCQRYYYRKGGGDVFESIGTGAAFSTTQANIMWQNPVEMRAAPAFNSNTASLWAVSGVASLTAITMNQTNPRTVTVNITVASGLVSGNGLFMFAGNNLTAYLELSAEL